MILASSDIPGQMTELADNVIEVALPTIAAVAETPSQHIFVEKYFNLGAGTIHDY